MRIAPTILSLLLRVDRWFNYSPPDAALPSRRLPMAYRRVLLRAPWREFRRMCRGMRLRFYMQEPSRSFPASVK